MNKIPVLGTLSRGYGFLIGDFVTIARLSWAPLLAATVVQFYFGAQTLDASIKALQSDDQSRMLSLGPMPFLLGVVVVVVNVMVFVALLRVVVSGDRKPGLWVYAWFGGAELRIIAVYLLLGIALAFVMVGSMLILLILAALSKAVPVIGIVILFGCVALIIALFWAALRVSLFVPVIVTESGLGVERSWQLTRGNALRLLVIWIATMVPLYIVTSVASSFIYGADMPALPDFNSMWTASHNDMKAFFQAAMSAVKPYQIAVAQAQLKHWPELCIFSFIYTMVSTAVYAGVSGSAYVSAAGRNA